MWAWHIIQTSFASFIVKVKKSFVKTNSLKFFMVLECGVKSTINSKAVNYRIFQKNLMVALTESSWSIFNFILHTCVRYFRMQITQRLTYGF